VRSQLLLVVLLSLGVRTFSQCDPPPYRRATSLKSSQGTFKVSVRPQDFNVNRILCLAEDLKKRHPEWEDIALLIFDSHDIAKKYAGYILEDVPSNRWAKNLHVMYSLHKAKGEEDLFILPFGYNTGPSDTTKIVLPVQGKPRCHYEVAGRCAIAFEGYDYLYRVGQAASGTVRVSATIDPDGRIDDVRVDEANISPADRRAECVSAAVQDFSRWRLEATGKKEALQMTYTYSVDRGLRQGDTEVRYDLPNAVLIQTNP
jgi:hypothetical protein